MKYWWTSDQHFGHENVIKYCARPFRDAAEQTAVLVANFNSRVSPGDVTYHLGDFSFLKKDQSAAILKSLNGSHILVLGNHDRTNTSMSDMGFMSVQHSLHVEIEGKRLFMSHIPPSSFAEPDREYKAVFKQEPHMEYDFHLCGHVHEKWARRGNVINVGVDQRNFYPASLDELLATPVE